MDRELGVVELLYRRVGLLLQVLPLPLAVILDFYCFSGAMDLYRGRTSGFSGMNMADDQQAHSSAAVSYKISHWVVSTMCPGDMFAAVLGEGYCQS